MQLQMEKQKNQTVTMQLNSAKTSQTQLEEHNNSFKNTLKQRDDELEQVKAKYAKLKQDFTTTKSSYETELQKCVVEMEQLRVIVQDVIQTRNAELSV